ncbi:MarC family integral membrane protein [Mucinivorans hirudinis]|uniref:UPF0056 membrane protein n=1 Tax=Mucinivorans hirudinis TaxID=1433126 RepID=A0A060RA15_9BACT|nr:MarC family integral membrane protein [Mucinivorans hirudinis]
MHDSLTFGLLCFTTFFTLMNPLGLVPVFITMTSTLDTEQKVTTARKATIAAMVTLIVFAFSGQLLFKFFGISADAFRVVGGIIFLFVGMDMLNARLTTTKITQSEVKSYVNDISITPLAIPMICGPGAITSSIVLMEDAHTLLRKCVLVGSIAVIGILTYIILVGATKISRLLGEVGNNVMMRLMGLIVMVIAVEFFFAGLTPFLQKIFIK